jgi:hypothetical protein
MEYIGLSIGLILLGAVAIYFTHKQAYEKGITTAVLLHRNGRLKYKDYLDDDGEKMVDIDISPIDDEE